MWFVLDVCLSSSDFLQLPVGIDLQTFKGIFIPIQSGEGDLNDHWALAMISPREAVLTFGTCRVFARVTAFFSVYDSTVPNRDWRRIHRFIRFNTIHLARIEASLTLHLVHGGSE